MQVLNKNQSVIESMPEGVTWSKEDIQMPSNRTKWLLDQLKVEFERGAYRKNIKIETLLKKLKMEGLSERDEYIFRIHIKPKFGKLTLKDAVECSKEYAEEVAREKVKSTAKKELLLFQRLIQLGDPSYKLPKLKFAKPGKKFHASQILEIDEILDVVDGRVFEPYRLLCKVLLSIRGCVGHSQERAWFSFHKLRHTAACYLLEQVVGILLECCVDRLES